MNYENDNRYLIIGERIRTSRKEAGYSQEALINELQRYGYRTPSRNTLSKAEGGNPEAVNSLSIGAVIGLSTLTGCDPGYFLGERDYRNHEVSLIHDKTGLSDEAIFKLVDMESENLKKILSKCIESTNLSFFLSIIEGIAKESSCEVNNDNHFVSLNIAGNAMRISYMRLLEWFFTEHIAEEIKAIASGLVESNEACEEC